MTILDWILLAALVIGLPLEALWHTLVRRDAPRPALTVRLTRSLRLVVAALTMLAVAWVAGDRPMAWLGLDAPLSAGGLIGLALAGTLIGPLALGAAAMPARSDAAAVGAGEMLVRTQGEARLFALFALVAGTGWELLYRGFVLWALTPYLGLAGAVVVAAIAYALGHRARDGRALAGSTISSLLFTLGFALTGSLWWLILLHIALPLLGLRAMRATATATRATA